MAFHMSRKANGMDNGNGDRQALSQKNQTGRQHDNLSEIWYLVS